MKGGKPEGLGKWTHVSDAIEGEWKDGKLNGKAVFYHSRKHWEEFEVQEGKRDGRSIHHWKGGRRLEREWVYSATHMRRTECWESYLGLMKCTPNRSEFLMRELHGIRGSTTRTGASMMITRMGSATESGGPGDLFADLGYSQISTWSVVSFGMWMIFPTT